MFGNEVYKWHFRPVPDGVWCTADVSYSLSSFYESVERVLK